MKNRLVQKAFTLAITVALLMVGLMLISDVVRDRINNRDRAVQSVVNSTAGSQTLYGPALVQQCTREVTGKDSEGRAEVRLVGFQRYALPDDVQTPFLPAMRHRIVLGPGAEIEGRSPDDVLTAILNRQDAPR